MISRLAVYHRWRRWQVMSLSYPLAGVIALGMVVVGIALIV